MDEQNMKTLIQVLRQMLADSQWREAQLQAEIIRLQTEQAPTGDQPG